MKNKITTSGQTITEFINDNPSGIITTDDAFKEQPLESIGHASSIEVICELDEEIISDNDSLNETSSESSIKFGIANDKYFENIMKMREWPSIDKNLETTVIEPDLIVDDSANSVETITESIQSENTITGTVQEELQTNNDDEITNEQVSIEKNASECDHDEAEKQSFSKNEDLVGECIKISDLPPSTQNDDTPISSEATETTDDAAAAAAPTAGSTETTETTPQKKTKTKSRRSNSAKRAAKKTVSQKARKDDDSDDRYDVMVSQRQRKYYLRSSRGENSSLSPNDDCEVFCSNIPINVLESELVPLFDRYGKIWNLRLLMSPYNSTRNAGFAFVRYTSPDAATNAIEKLNKYEIVPGKYLAVKHSEPNLCLFVGNIHRGQTKDQIHEKFDRISDGLVKTVVKGSFYEEAKNCGFCFLEYESHLAASLAKQKLTNGRTKVWGRQLFVDWSQRRTESDPEKTKNCKTIFLNNLPKTVNADVLKEKLTTFGDIERVTQIKDYAFVMFEKHDDAAEAVKSFDVKQQFEGGDTVEISLAVGRTLRKPQRINFNRGHHFYPVRPHFRRPKTFKKPLTQTELND